jgi:glyoxylase-like metal-dependent hydrolase (beta-lactamase superfamily II)
MPVHATPHWTADFPRIRQRQAAAMTVHHLDCAPMRPLGAGAPLVGHCLLVEGSTGLLLVDTGLGAADVSEPRRLGTGFRTLMRPRLDLSLTAVHQIRKLGYDVRDVTDIVLTHLDLDHTGGLADFPGARVHVHVDEYRAAMRRDTRLDAGRYLPVHWEHGPQWVIHDTADFDWFGLRASRVLSSPDVLLVPLPGHTQGHCAVAVAESERWLLHCGDAYFHHREIDLRRPRCPRGFAAHQRMIAADHHSRLDQVEVLRELRRDHPGLITVFCSHDPLEFRRLTDRH